MIKFYPHIALLLSLIISGCHEVSKEPSQPTDFEVEVTFLNVSTSFMAGDKISLQFDNSSSAYPEFSGFLHISHSSGFTSISPKTINGILYFELPEVLTKKSGSLSCTLTHGNRTIWSKKLSIEPNTIENQQLEVYYGPPSINAGKSDHSMIVALPTDRFDNLLPDSTALNYSQHHDENLQLEQWYTNGGYSWKKVYSPTNSGRYHMGITMNTATSKEIIIDVLPNTAQEISVTLDRVHAYADGNEIIHLTTNVIKDAYGNTISDGTLVDFHIIDNRAQKSRTQGSTINGIAQAQLQHPDYPTQWTVTPEIPGVTMGDPITAKFEIAVKEVAIFYKKEEGLLEIGPIRNQLNQSIPDGTEIEIDFSHSTAPIILESKNGMAHTILPKEGTRINEIIVTVLGYKTTKDFED
ncbi:hypothetical protein POV27_16625 [Aureisphaera galaxeae]|uniref:hypothetical protein n=1 Tax=Aureisphaera galaxeae TaxID=1538023 RepID=UPI00235038EE|nr:hypothetical protein [Aureisphaera galaxeae]MDC8005685.1 hypothetical protein [Aureisphaera galaxeae]